MLEILLIDDETSIRLPVGDALRARGHRVATAADGDEAMARLDSEVFHLVVSDVRLPKGGRLLDPAPGAARLPLDRRAADDRVRHHRRRGRRHEGAGGRLRHQALRRRRSW